MGVLLGYAWRSTEYLVAARDVISQCWTVRRRADKEAFDVKLTDAVVVRYEDFILKGAKTTIQIRMPKQDGGDSRAAEPVRGSELVPRRIYAMPRDVVKYGFTQGCPGCTFAQTGIGPKRNHNEACRVRMESKIAKDALDERVGKAKDRQDHYFEQKIKESEEPKRLDDSRTVGSDKSKEPNDIEMKIDGLPDEVTIDDGVDKDSIEDRRVDNEIIHRAILGHDLTEMFSDKRLQLAGDIHFVNQLLRVDMSEMFSPERVTAVCRDYGLEPGQAKDLKNVYDLDLAADRQKAWESIMRDKPMLVIGSPPCTHVSRLQN